MYVGAVLGNVPAVVVVLTVVEPLAPGVALVVGARGAGEVGSTARLGAPLDWIVPPHSDPAHLNAGRSFGRGGGFPVFEGGEGVDPGGGIVGGGAAPACALRGITAKLGKLL